MFNLGIAYDSGRGIKVIDKNLALCGTYELLKKECQQHKYNVSVMYDDGVGVEKNPTLALMVSRS